MNPFWKYIEKLTKVRRKHGFWVRKCLLWEHTKVFLGLDANVFYDCRLSVIFTWSRSNSWSSFMLSSEVTFFQIFVGMHIHSLLANYSLYIHNEYWYIVNLLYIVKVRSQDAVCGLAVVTREGRDVAWSWL